jgi:hypothetical protein
MSKRIKKNTNPEHLKARLDRLLEIIFNACRELLVGIRPPQGVHIPAIMFEWIGHSHMYWVSSVALKVPPQASEALDVEQELYYTLPLYLAEVKKMVVG